MNAKLMISKKDDSYLHLIPVFRDKKQRDSFESMVKTNTVNGIQTIQYEKKSYRNSIARNDPKSNTLIGFDKPANKLETVRTKLLHEMLDTTTLYADGAVGWVNASTKLSKECGPDNCKEVTIYVQGHGSAGSLGMSSDEGDYADTLKIAGSLDNLVVEKISKKCHIKLNSCFSGAGTRYVYENRMDAMNALKDETIFDKCRTDRSLAREVRRHVGWGKLSGYMGSTSIYKNNKAQSINNKLKILEISTWCGERTLDEETHMTSSVHYKNNDHVDSIQGRRKDCRKSF